MENADNDLKDIEDELRALAAADRTPRAQDAALLARLAEKADCAYHRRSLRPWYRSPMLWRGAAALVLLALIPFIWQSLHPVEGRGGVAVAASVKAAQDATLEITAEPQVVAVADMGPAALPVAPAAIAVAEPRPVPESATYETAIAVYSGGAETACDTEAECDDTATPTAPALAINSVHGVGASTWDKAMPTARVRSVPTPQAAPTRACGVAKAKRAARPRSIADKLKKYAAALQRAAAAP